MWLGPAAVAPFLVAHLWMTPKGSDRRREIRFVVAIGLVGTLIDSLLKSVGAITYPTSEAVWQHALVPPWIIGLWLAFAMLPRYSLGWLRHRPLLAFALGGLGGPLSFFAGTRFDAVAAGTSHLLTYGVLALEYAIAMPLLLRLSPANDLDPCHPGRSAQSGPPN